MKQFNTLDEIVNIKETVVALGNFDGVHKGHQELIRRTVKSAKMAGLKVLSLRLPTILKCAGRETGYKKAFCIWKIRQKS